jgi:hypothetical protein
VWTAAGAIADVNALLAGATFSSAAGYTSDFTIATSVDDSTAPALTGAKSVTLASDPTPPPLPVDDPDPDPIIPPEPEPDPEPPPEEPPPVDPPEEEPPPETDPLSEGEPGDSIAIVPPTSTGFVPGQQGPASSALRRFAERTIGGLALELGVEFNFNELVEQSIEDKPAWSILPPKTALANAFGFQSTVLDILSVNALEYLENSLDGLQQEAENEIAIDQVVASSAIAVTTGMSVGYVAWLLRSGVLLSSLLSSMPAWRVLDPLPVLAGKLDDDEEQDEESLESIIEGPSPPPVDDLPEEKSAIAAEMEA